MYRIFLIIISCCFLLTAKAEMINVGILVNNDIKEAVFLSKNGKYAIVTEKGVIKEVDETEAVQFSIIDNYIELKTLDEDLGKFKKVHFVGLNEFNAFKIQLLNPKINYKYKIYDDNLIILPHFYYKKLTLINNLQLDNYVAGVVQSEVGSYPPFELLKLQAVICRTYALKNIDRHINEGYSLCDNVHCQAYNHQATKQIVREAAYETSGAVIVDSNIELITAVFFSNCGGQTANSEDVWNSEVYYLRSVKDSFCLGQNNANWTKKIPKSDWEKYLIAKGFSKEWFEEEECALEYFQCQREKDFEKNNISIPLVDIRKDWKLKSTFFDVEVDGNYVILKGKGFGHGVGMCQEGAMNMAEKGYTYIDILHHYYKGVHMIDLKALDFFKEDF